MGTESTGVRQALVDAATELFVTEGFDAVSLEQVRRRAGVSNGSLFHHFATKAHLARAVYLQALRDYQAHMLGAITARTSARDGVRRLVGRHIDWLLASPREALVLDRLRSVTVVDGRAPDWEAENVEAFGRLSAWIDAHVARGELRPLPLDVWLALVVGPALQLTPVWARKAPRRLAPGVRAALADAAWAGVRAASSSSEEPDE